MTSSCNFTLQKHEDSSSSSSPHNWWKSIPDPKSSSILKLLREMERLCLISEHGVDELKHKLMVYKAGDFWLPVGGMKKEEMDIPPVITVLLVGLRGSGKSSLVNLMYSVLGRTGLIPFTQTSNESCKHSTTILEEHNVLRSTRNGFCVYDTMGLDMDRMGEGLEEVTRWMTHGVLHNQPCGFGEGDHAGVILNQSFNGFSKRKVNYAMVVVDLTDVHKAFFCGGDFKPVVAIKLLFHCPSIRTSNADPLLIITHGDMLQPMERLNARIKICSYLGIPVTTGVYDIVCLTEQGLLPEEFDPVTYFALTEAVYRILLQSDRTHSPKKTYDWILDILSRLMCSLACFFAMLSRIFQEWGDKQKMVDVIKRFPKKTG